MLIFGAGINYGEVDVFNLAKNVTPSECVIGKLREPYDISHGAVRPDGTPVICTLIDRSYRIIDCLTYENNQWVLHEDVFDYDPSENPSVYVPNHGLFIADSQNSQLLDLNTITSKVVSNTPSMNLIPNCMVQVNDSHTFMIGEEGRKVWIYDWTTNTSKSLPNLLDKDRAIYFSCGLYNHQHLVVIGGYSRNTTEIMDLKNPDKWTEGPMSPMILEVSTVLIHNGRLFVVKVPDILEFTLEKMDYNRI